MMRKNRKYDDILTAAGKLFYLYGLRKVTVEDVCREAGVSKMTFYKYFPNKIELAKSMLAARFEYWLDRYKAVMYSELPFSEKMKTFLEFKMEATGDASKDFIRDVYFSENGEFKGFIEAWLKRGKEETIAMFSIAQEKGWMRKDLKPVLLMALLNKISEVALDERMLSFYPEMPELTKEVTKFFLYGVSEER